MIDKIINLSFVGSLLLFLLPSINLGFIYSQGFAKVFGIFGLALIVMKYFSNKKYFPNNLVNICFFIYFFSQSISVINTVDITSFLASYKILVYLLIFYMVGQYVLADKTTRERSMAVLLITSVISLGIKALIFFRPVIFMNTVGKIINPGYLELIVSNINRGRVYFESFDEVLIPILIFMLINRKSNKILLSILLIAIVFLSFIGGFRTNLLMSIFALFFSFLYLIAKDKKLILRLNNLFLIVIIIATIFLAGLIATKIVGFSYVDRLMFTDKTEDVLTVNNRLIKWQEAVGIGSKHLFFGVGLGNYNIYLPSSQKQPLLYGSRQEKIINEGLLNPHNLLFFTFAETGLVGLLSLLSILFFFLKEDIKTIRKKSKHKARAYIISFWTLFTFSLLNPTVYVTYNALFWYLRLIIQYENLN